MLEYFRNKKVMVVVAHPDDELLGLGASINKLINEYNVRTHLVILGEGITSRSIARDTEAWKLELEEHKRNIETAQKIIGYHSVSIYDLPDNRFDSVDLLDVIKIIENEKLEFQPSIIFTHHGGDLNVDHQKTFEAVVTVTRPMKDEIVEALITFETPSGTEWQAISDPRRFSPNFFISVSENNINKKIEAMEKYKYEKRGYPHPRSPEALKIQAQRWGIANGKDFSEAFQIIRINS